MLCSDPNSIPLLPVRDSLPGKHQIKRDKKIAPIFSHFVPRNILSQKYRVSILKRPCVKREMSTLNLIRVSVIVSPSPLSLTPTHCTRRGWQSTATIPSPSSFSSACVGRKACSRKASRPGLFMMAWTTGELGLTTPTWSSSSFPPAKCSLQKIEGRPWPRQHSTLLADQRGLCAGSKNAANNFKPLGRPRIPHSRRVLFAARTPVFGLV